MILSLRVVMTPGPLAVVCVCVSARVTSPTTWLAPTVPSNTQFAFREKLTPRQQIRGINCFMLD